jgi:hypothetical protein
MPVLTVELYYNTGFVRLIQGHLQLLEQPHGTVYHLQLYVTVITCSFKALFKNFRVCIHTNTDVATQSRLMYFYLVKILLLFSLYHSSLLILFPVITPVQQVPRFLSRRVSWTNISNAAFVSKFS